MKTTSDVRAILAQDVLQEYLKERAVNHLWLTGSWARDEADQDSDVDVVVQLDEGRVDTSFFELPVYLEEQLGKKVDVIDKDYVDPLVEESLLADAVLLW